MGADGKREDPDDKKAYSLEEFKKKYLGDKDDKKQFMKKSERKALQKEGDKAADDKKPEDKKLEVTEKEVLKLWGLCKDATKLLEKSIGGQGPPKNVAKWFMEMI